MVDFCNPRAKSFFLISVGWGLCSSSALQRIPTQETTPEAGSYFLFFVPAVRPA